MKNFVQPGEVVTATAPYDVAVGGGVKVGSLIGIATIGAASGKDVTVKRTGVFRDLPKATGTAWVAWTTKIYWDDTNKVFTHASSGNTLVGIASAAAASGDTTGSALLTGQIV